MVRYIHQNPLKAGLVSDLDRYRWSSHWGYLKKETMPRLAQYGIGFRTVGWTQGIPEFMDGEVEEEIEEFYKDPYQKPVLGGKGVIERIREKLGKWTQKNRNRGKSSG